MTGKTDFTDIENLERAREKERDVSIFLSPFFFVILRFTRELNALSHFYTVYKIYTARVGKRIKKKVFDAGIYR